MARICLLVLGLTLLACNAEPRSDVALPSPAAGKADDASGAQTVVVPMPEVEGERGLFLAYEEVGPSATPTLDATGSLYAPARAECPDLEAIYGEPGRTLCEAGMLGLPVGTVDRLPSIAQGVVEIWAQSSGTLEPDLGLPMLVFDLDAGELLAPEVSTLDGTRLETVDVVRRIQLTPEGVRVWSRDPANGESAPLSGMLERDPAGLAVMVLPDPAPALTPGTLTDYAFTLAMRCEAENPCVFARS
ncbi:MAG: hypothetical protein ACE37F_11780 [Nannocystaceae bacterium]|nr:hypothetical protein [bacterium]